VLVSVAGLPMVGALTATDQVKVRDPVTSNRACGAGGSRDRHKGSLMWKGGNSWEAR
jgi:hypothetical protein